MVTSNFMETWGKMVTLERLSARGKLRRVVQSWERARVRDFETIRELMGHLRMLIRKRVAQVLDEENFGSIRKVPVG